MDVTNAGAAGEDIISNHSAEPVLNVIFIPIINGNKYNV